MLSPEERVLCGLLVSRGLITAEQLSFCTTLSDGLSPGEPKRSVGDALAESGHVDRELVGELLREAGRLLAALETDSSLRGVDRLGPYRIVRELGRGGMGTVFEAEDDRTGERVALKVLSELAGEPRRRTRFEREIAAAQRVAHPGVVRLLDSGAARGLHYYAMELVRGRSLQELLRDGPLCFPDAARIALAVAEAVDHAHGLGLIHRDIKPGNILVGDDGTVKVADFGIVHGADDDTLSTAASMLGTPSFICVEQACGDDPLPHHDIYAIGAVLYAMLTGRPPYESEFAVTVLLQLITHPPAPVVQARPDCPAGLAAICEKAMARAPAARYRSAGALAEDLRRWQRGDAPDALARVPGIREDRPAGTRRWAWPSIVSLAAPLLVAIVGVVVVGSRWGRPARPVEPPAWVDATRLTFTSSREVFPTFHPDGERYAYACEGRVFLARLPGPGEPSAPEPELLTPGVREYCTECSFSPDGSRIAYRRGPNGGLHLLDLATRESRPLTSTGFNPSWSPDSRSIVHAMRPSVGNGRGDETSEMWIVDVDTGASRPLTPMKGAQPRWSPGGGRIAFWNHTSSGSTLWTVSAAGGVPLAVTDGRYREWNPVWSPDGAFLYFVSDRSGWSNIWRLPIDEGTGRPRGPPVPVTTDISCISYHPAFTADGARMLFARWTYNDAVVAFRLDRRTDAMMEGPVAPIPFRGVHRHPSVSPDGRMLVFTRDDRHVNVVLYRIGSEDPPRALASAPSLDDLPRWSPDGRWIAFDSNRDGSRQIWIVHADGTDLHRVTEVREPTAYGPFWAPDGRQLGFSVERSGTFIVPFDPNAGRATGPPRPLPPAPFARSFVASDWRPDGEAIVGTCGFEIVVHDLVSGSYRKLADGGQEPIWLPEGDEVLFIREGGLWAVRADGTAMQRPLFRSSTLRLGGRIALAPDGVTLYATEARSESDLWLLSRDDGSGTLRQEDGR